MTLVMGVLNVTPDSFSDGGCHVTVTEAVAHGLRLVADGAALVDVGGESTRPGAVRVPLEQELDRVVPVIEVLAAEGVACSVDTMRPEVAAAAVAVGAVLVNDVSGGLADERMLGTVAELGVDYVAMHWRAHSATMQQHTDYDDVVTDVCAALTARRDAAVAAGIAPERIILDPGIGFAKTSEQNWQLLRSIGSLQALGHRVLIGVSRKRFLGELLGRDDPGERDVATAALSTWCAVHGVWGVRTHEVRMQVDAIAVGERLRRPPIG